MKYNKITKEHCVNLAKQCVYKHEFVTLYHSAYKATIKHKWVDEVCGHLVKLKKPNNYWNKENTHIEALKYNTKSDFAKKSKGAYNSALKNGWLTEICNHMIELGSIYKRYNYVYEFDDNHVYIGLTCNIDRRNNEHNNSNNSPVFRHIMKTGLSPKLISDDLKPVHKAKEIEINTILLYEQNGWVLLNSCKGGGIGSGIKSKWNNETCHQEALKFKTRLEFQKKSHTAYKHCLKHKLLDIVCSHMIKNSKKKKSVNKKWDFNSCHQEALKYKTRGEFHKNCQNAYSYSIRNNFLNEICSHMIKHKDHSK